MVGFISAMDDPQSSILFRQSGMGARAGLSGGLDEMENSRRITSNFLFGNTTLPYDFGLMTQMGMEQPAENIDVSNNNFTFIHTSQRTKYVESDDRSSTLIGNCSSLVNESGNDGTWLTVFGFRTNANAQILINEFSRLGVIEKYVVGQSLIVILHQQSIQIVDESNLCHLKFETRLQAQRALRKHGHVFGQIMIGVRYCIDKVNDCR
jgi:hypothetical protein